MTTRFSVFLLLLFAPGIWIYADEAENKAIAQDFCHAVAAQALCDKHLTMPKGTEAALEAKVGAKLRGDGTPLNEACEAGYAVFYDLEGDQGLDAACAATLSLYGPSGSKRAGLVSAP